MFASNVERSGGHYKFVINNIETQGQRKVVEGMLRGFQVEFAYNDRFHAIVVTSPNMGVLLEVQPLIANALGR